MKQFLEKYYDLFGGVQRTVEFIYFDEEKMKNMRLTGVIDETMTFEELRQLLQEKFNLPSNFYLTYYSTTRRINNNENKSGIITSIGQLLHGLIYKINLV